MDSALVSLLGGAGVAGVFCVLFIFRVVVPGGVVDDLKEENLAKEQALIAAQAALVAERDRGDTLERIIVNAMVRSGVEIPDDLLEGRRRRSRITPLPGGASSPPAGGAIAP